MTGPLVLVSHRLCPYAQRVAIALAEKGAAFTRIDIDLADKPDWFTAISPLGKVPLLEVGDAVIFESHVILDYLEETLPPSFYPADPLARARHRGWIALASEVLGEITGFYNAPDPAGLDTRAARLRTRFARAEAALAAGPWFDGARFSLVDAAWAPIFRYLDAFEEAGDFGLTDGLTGVCAWRRALAERPSVRAAVAPDYAERLHAFLRGRDSALARRLAAAAA